MHLAVSQSTEGRNWCSELLGALQDLVQGAAVPKMCWTATDLKPLLPVTEVIALPTSGPGSGRAGGDRARGSQGPGHQTPVCGRLPRLVSAHGGRRAGAGYEPRQQEGWGVLVCAIIGHQAG